MSLKEELAALKARAEARRPPEVVALMHRAVDDVRRTGALERVPGVGDRAPEFALPNAEERPVSSRELLARGPLVVTFYRGGW
jgi:AhpC/TSA family